VDRFDDVCLQLLQHLDREGLSAQQAAQLSGAPFIPVAHSSRLVAPNQLFMRLGGAALAPFAWEVPGQVRCAALRVAARSVVCVHMRMHMHMHMHAGGLLIARVRASAPHARSLRCAPLLQFVGRAVLLRQLGVREEPRAEDLVAALSRFAAQLAGRRMNPNELAACMREQA
jgi:hypothetical protein